MYIHAVALVTILLCLRCPMEVTASKLAEFTYLIKYNNPEESEDSEDSETKNIVWNYEYRLVPKSEHFILIFSEQKLSNDQRIKVDKLTNGYLSNPNLSSENYTTLLLNLYTVRKIIRLKQNQDKWRVNFPRMITFDFNNSLIRQLSCDVDLAVNYVSVRYNLTPKAKSELNAELTYFTTKVYDDIELIKDICSLSLNDFYIKTPNDHTKMSKYLLVQLSVLKQLKEKISMSDGSTITRTRLEEFMFNVESHVRCKIPDKFVSLTQLRDALGLEEVEHEKFPEIFDNGNVICINFMGLAFKMLDILQINHFYSLDFLKDFGTLIYGLRCHNLKQVVELNSTTGALSYFLKQVGVKPSAVFINRTCKKPQLYPNETQHVVSLNKLSDAFKKYSTKKVLYICDGGKDDELLKLIVASKYELCVIFLGYINIDIFNKSENIKVRELGFSTYPQNYNVEKIRLVAVNYSVEAWKAIMSTISKLYLET